MEFCMESLLLEMPCRRVCLVVSYLRISQKRMQRMVRRYVSRCDVRSLEAKSLAE